MADDTTTPQPEAEDEARHGLGGNLPPPDLKIGPALVEELKDNHEHLLARLDELMDMADRFDADHATVDNDDISGVLAGIITQMNGHRKVSDQVREGVKAPYLEGGRLVDGFFTGGIVAPLEKRMGQLNEKQTAYQSAKAARARAAAAAEAERQREEAERRRQEAETAERERIKNERAARKARTLAAATATDLFEAAVQMFQSVTGRPPVATTPEALLSERGRLSAEQQSDWNEAVRARIAETAPEHAEALEKPGGASRLFLALTKPTGPSKAEQEALERAEEATERAQEATVQQQVAATAERAAGAVATKSSAELSRVRGDYAMSSLRTTWDFRVTDISKVPADYLQVNAPLIRAAIRGRDGKRNIPGLEIFPVEKSVNR